MAAGNRDTMDTMRKMLVLMDGRDKSIKLVQYASKVIVWAYLSRPSSNLTISSKQSLEKRLRNLSSAFSQTRKIIRLGHAIEPYTNLKDLLIKDTRYPNTIDSSLHNLAILNSIICILNDVSDDIYCLCKIGFLKSKNIEEKTENLSAILWLFSIWLDLHENWWTQSRLRYHINDLKKKKKFNQDIKEIEHQSKSKSEEIIGEKSSSFTEINIEIFKANDKLYWHKITQYKLLMDLIFCWYDCYPKFRISDGIQAVSGFLSGILGFYKLYRKIQDS